MRAILVSAILLILLAHSPQVWAETQIVDGDTFDLDGVRIRISGIDAPEAGQKCGNWNCGVEATNALFEMLHNSSVHCETQDEDAYGRTVAVCFSDESDVGKEMVRRGYAWAFVKYSERYVAEEEEARSKKRGIWAYSSQAPWEYRAQKWQEAKQTAPDGCPIKGNITTSGKIYHPPWSPWYLKTRIDTTQGERWFCTEEEALAAGWRAPRWR